MQYWHLMLDFYLEIKYVHVAAALISGGLFIARGVGVQAAGHWPMAAPVRYLSYTIDTILLGAAITLLVVLPAAVFGNGWLIVKLCWVGAYVALGTFALKRGRTPRARLVCFLAALCAYGNIVAVAIAHHPLGLLLWLPGALQTRY